MECSGRSFEAGAVTHEPGHLRFVSLMMLWSPLCVQNDFPLLENIARAEPCCFEAVLLWAFTP